MKVIRLFKQYEKIALKAFQCIRAEDEGGYRKCLLEAEAVRIKAQRLLSKRDFKQFSLCIERTVDVLKKCTALGLVHLEKRLSEFRIGEGLYMSLKERNQAKRQEYQEGPWMLKAA